MLNKGCNFALYTSQINKEATCEFPFACSFSISSPPFWIYHLEFVKFGNLYLGLVLLKLMIEIKIRLSISVWPNAGFVEKPTKYI